MSGRKIIAGLKTAIAHASGKKAVKTTRVIQGYVTLDVEGKHWPIFYGTRTEARQERDDNADMIDGRLVVRRAILTVDMGKQKAR